MAANLAIECADRSVRWYLTPGQTSRYEITVTNQSGDETVECNMALDDPPAGGAFEPSSFALRPRERKTVALTFGEDTQVPRDQRTLISVRDKDGIVIASFERGLISAGGTDCTVTLSWKEPIVDGDEVRGFVISCAIKSLSVSPGSFALQFTPHPALEFVDVAPIKLQPGQTETVAIPILWKRLHKDALGLDHPHVIEISVAVSQGRRSGRLAWDVVESRLAALRPPPAPAASATAVAIEQAPPCELPIPDGSEAAAVASPSQSAPIEQAPASPPALPARPATSELVRADAGASESSIMDDDALMALLVGKPVSPPAGWRSPGRDAPDASDAPPPSIFAKTPPTVTGKPVLPPQSEVPPVSPASAPVRDAAPPAARPEMPSPAVPPAQVVPPAARPQMPNPAIPPRETVPPAARPQLPNAGAAAPYRPPTADIAPPAARPQLPPGSTAADVDAGAAAFTPAVFEAAIVGPPPARMRTIQTRQEHAANLRRAAEIERAPNRMRDLLPILVMGGTGIIAVVLVLLVVFRPGAQSTAPEPTPSPTMPAPVVFENFTPAARPKPSVKPSASIVPSIAPSAAARVLAQSTQRVIATSAPAQVARPIASTQRPVAVVPRAVRKPRRNPNAIVAIQGIFARYGASGRAVRVLWGASSQASAEVQISDDRGGILSQTQVPGPRQNALLYVPRSYHGSVFVQVVSIGFRGERVTQSTSLPPYAR